MLSQQDVALYLLQGWGARVLRPWGCHSVDNDGRWGATGALEQRQDQLHLTSQGDSVGAIHLTSKIAEPVGAAGPRLPVAVTCQRPPALPCLLLPFTRGLNSRSLPFLPLSKPSSSSLGSSLWLSQHGLTIPSGPTYSPNEQTRPGKPVP